MKNDSYSALLRGLPALYETRTLEELPRHFLQFISRLVPADTMAYNEVNLKRPQIRAMLVEPELNWPAYERAFVTHMDQHPLIQHQRTTGDLTARKISDFLSRAQFQRLPLYQEVYRHLGVEDQIALTLDASPDAIVALAISRRRRTFTQEQQELLNLVRPHLAQAYRNAEALARLQERLTAARDILENMPLALIVLGPDGRMLFAAKPARDLLQKYLPPPASAQELPEELRGWLSRSRRCNGQNLPNTTSDFSVETPMGKLQVRFVTPPGSKENFLVLEETGAPHSAKSLQGLGLTPRESEVLLWVTQGKTNPEIGIILGAARRTVQKHLEHIFAKLGVESRTAAARCALEVLNSPS